MQKEDLIMRKRGKIKQLLAFALAGMLTVCSAGIPVRAEEKGQNKPAENSQNVSAEDSRNEIAGNGQKKPAEENQSKPAENSQKKSSEENQNKPAEDYQNGSVVTAFEEGKTDAIKSDLLYFDECYKPDFLKVNDSVPRSFLALTSNGYMRLKTDQKAITVFTYDKKVRRTGSKTIKRELPYVDGFYEGSEYYFLFFNQENREENGNAEVFRIVKYDKSWKRLGAASIKGNNIVYGMAYSVHADEYNGSLYVHTDRSMYKSSDGLNHESNIIFKIRISDMKVTDLNGNSWNVSHSFDEFVKVDDSGNIMTLNKGDYDGAAILGTFEKKDKDSKIFDSQFYCDNIIDNPYTHGDGIWGFENHVYLGGLEYSKSSYLTAGSSLTLDDQWDNNEVSNIYLSVTPRSDVTKEEVYIESDDSSFGYILYPLTKKGTTSIRWLTAYAEGSGKSCSKPKFIKLSDDRFLIMWAVLKPFTNETFNYTIDANNVLIDSTQIIASGKISYVIVDGKGKTIQQTKTVDGYLSDCNLVADNNKIIWYATPYKGPTAFYVLDLSTNTIKKTNTTIAVTGVSIKETATVNSGMSIQLKATVTPTDAGNKSMTWQSSNTKVAKVDSTGKVTGIAQGTAVITATSKDNPKVKDTCKVTVLRSLKKPGNCHFVKWNNAKYNSCRIAWNKVNGADGYQTILSWTDGSHGTWTRFKSNVLQQDCEVAVNHVSQLKVRAFYNDKSGKRIYGPWSNVEYITPSPAKLTYKNASSGKNLKAKISWDIIYGCNGYNVFLTTNPNGKWYWNQSTEVNARATNATITKYRGSKLKRNTKYYVRIVTRRKRNGVFCTVPMPAADTYTGTFTIK